MSEGPPPLPPDVHPARPPVPVVVLGEFGRDAALRFCRVLSFRERERIQAALPAGEPFLDEYRRATLTLVGDLPYVKEAQLDRYRREQRILDDQVLVGFPGGPQPGDVAPRLGVLLLEALAGPAARGATRAVVALPCNTLAPVSWALDCAFVDAPSVRRLLVDAGAAGRTDLDRAVAAVSAMDLRFPSVPTAVLTEVGKDTSAMALPLGTLDIVEIYGQARRRRASAPEVVAPDAAGQRAVLTAIQACLAGDDGERARATDALRGAVARAETGVGGRVVPIEACTDLRLGLGIDSTATYADAVLAAVYDEPLES
ncbi:MAG: hypothetical protein QGH45_06670 [Myxococcota bacterium]|nr:hypothetical protein [Myxococcota bacterium]